MANFDTQVAVIGGGVVGCAVVHALARRGVEAALLEAGPGLALGASGANSGILHTGFDSTPGELETELILRSGELRGRLVGELGVNVWRCGAQLTPSGMEERAAVARMAGDARTNGVQADLQPDGSLVVPGEAVTDPVAFVHALAGAAAGAGATVRLGAEVGALASVPGGGILVELASGERLRVRAAANCAGLHADEVARMAGEEPVAIYPRKGEFLVFAPPAGAALERILLPVPSSLGKGVLVFPTIGGEIVAGPTAREREDKDDWSVEADASELIMARAMRMFPALEGATQVGAYAGLRPAGRNGNYVIEPSRTLPALVHVAAIRSTGLSASLGIGEHVAGMLGALAAIDLGGERRLAEPAQPATHGRWWERAARYHAAARSAEGIG